MASMKYCDKHNQVGFLKKPEENAGFIEITATASTLADGTIELRATIDTVEYTITKASVRSKLQLADTSGISMLPNTEFLREWGIWVPPPPTSQPAPTKSTTIPPTPIPEPTSKPLSPPTAPEHETMEHHFEQPSPEHQQSSPRQASDIPQTQAPTHTHEAENQGTCHEDGEEIKKNGKDSKSRRVALTDLEDEDTENSSKQGRNLQKDESEVFETPKQGKSLGETDISPQGLEHMKPSEVLIPKSRPRGEVLYWKIPKKLKSVTREDVSFPKEKDKESVKKEDRFEIKKPVLRYTKRKSLGRKGLQRKPESTKSALR
ncbi:hypothetical protein Tco_0708988 [Tanacetum coccineum]